jgi:hypothetical protein
MRIYLESYSDSFPGMTLAVWPCGGSGWRLPFVDVTWTPFDKWAEVEPTLRTAFFEQTGYVPEYVEYLWDDRVATEGLTRVSCPSGVDRVAWVEIALIGT